MFGYESYVTINDQIVLATSADIVSERTKIESSGLYGGSLNQVGSSLTLPLQQPHYYDWSDNSGSITADVSHELLTIIKDLILGRSNSFDVKIYSRIDGLKHMRNAWWNSISISAQEDSALTATISFIGLENESFEIGLFSGYWDNEDGLNTCDNLGNPLNPDEGNVSPIPFWKTEVLGIENVKNWTFTISQDVVKFMGCMNSISISDPYILGVGLMRSDMKINSVLPDVKPDDSLDMYNVYDGTDIVNSRKQLSIKVDSYNYLLLDGEINRLGDPLQGNSALNNIDWDFTVYDFSFV